MDPQKNNKPVFSVDDLLVSNIDTYILVASVACHEAVFIILGFAMPALQQIMVSMEKLEEMVLRFSHICLSLEVNTRTMMVSIPSSYINEVLVIIESKWFNECVSVALSELEQLGGKFGHIT